MEVEIRGFEQLGSLFDDVVSLDVFSPDIEQTDAWPLDAIDSRNEGTTHHCELHELLGGATDVGTKIERRGRAPAGR